MLRKGSKTTWTTFSGYAQFGCALTLVAVASTAAEFGLRQSRPIVPWINGARLSKCSRSGVLACSSEETQMIANAFCAGAGYSFAYYWQVGIAYHDQCSLIEKPILRGSWSTIKSENTCQALNKIICTGPKIVGGSISVGQGTGTIAFSQNGKNAPVMISITFQGLPEAYLYLCISQYTITEERTHTGPKLQCTSAQESSTSFKLGMLDGPTAVQSWRTNEISLFGPHLLEGDSFFIMNMDGKLVSSGKLQQEINGTLPETLKTGWIRLRVPTANVSSLPCTNKRKICSSSMLIKGNKTKMSSTLWNHDSKATRALLDTIQEADVSTELNRASNRTQVKQDKTPSTVQSTISLAPWTARCPLGKACQSVKCRTDCDGLKTCCRCKIWLIGNGVCAPNGWIKTSGPGNCEFTSSCPVGVVCTGVKILKTFGPNGYEELCCECLEHNPDGSCKSNSFQPVRGSGDCSFEVTPSEMPDGKGAEAQGD